MDRKGIIAVTLSVIALFAWMFFTVCERPFMTSLAVKARPKSESAPVDEEEIGLAEEAA